MTRLRRYRAIHRTVYDYGATMLDGYTVANLLARPTSSQRVESTKLTSDPSPDEYDESTDVFGNRVAQLGLHQPHDRLVVEAVSVVSVRRPAMPRVDPTWEHSVRLLDAVRGGTVNDLAPFRARSRFVDLAGSVGALESLASPTFRPGRPTLDAVTDLCHTIFDTFEFDPTSTDISTPLPDVIAQRAGVCQDFAHVMIGCLRARGLAARYVSGYIETDPPPGEPKTVGADASHAWCSVWIPEHGWVDVDPTNGLVGADRHVTIGWGRDYADVAPVRGVVIGPISTQRLTVSVDVTRLD